MLPVQLHYYLNILFKVFAISVVLSGLTSCATVSYYSHIMNGHHDLMEGEEEIEEIIAQDKYDETIRDRLKTALTIRRFASEQLGLPDNDSYKSFVKLDRPYPVWNVIATEKFSVEAKKWCFLIVGCISYRGYFNQQDADNKAKELAAEGYDVNVSPAAAYSTLGWFDDPLLSSMLYKEEVHLAGIIFHELAHQKVYADDDSAFNEAFATAVELEGVRRWLEYRNNGEAIKRYRKYKQRQRDFNQLLKNTRMKLAVVYQASSLSEDDRLSKKQVIIAEMKENYKSLKQGWDGYKGYDKWMQRDINNAHLALVATYHDLVPAFEAMLRLQDNKLESFYKEVKKTAELPFNLRRAHLQELAKQNSEDMYTADSR